MTAFFLALWAAIGGVQVLALFVAGGALMLIPIGVSALITRLVCGSAKRA